MNRKNSDSSCSRRKSSVTVKRITASKEEEQNDISLKIFDNFLTHMNLPALYEKAMKNVDSKIASMSAEEIEEAVQTAKQNLSNNFSLAKEDLVATSSSTKRQSFQPSKDKNIIKSSQKKKVHAKSSYSGENVKKSNENRTLSFRKNRRPPDRYVPEVKDLEKRLKYRWEYEAVGRKFEMNKNRRNKLKKQE